MPAGRPLELTPAVIERVKELLPRALYVETIAASLGISRECWRKWTLAGAKEQRRRERGKEPDVTRELHYLLVGTIQKTLSAAEVDFLSVVQAAGTETWTALAWILERRFPERWATNRGELRALAKQIAAIAKQGKAIAKSDPKSLPEAKEGDGKPIERKAVE